MIISGGLTIHTFEDWDAFVESTAKPIYHEFSDAVSEAAIVEDVSVSFHYRLFLFIRELTRIYLLIQPEARMNALYGLASHRSFRKAHPREEHFIPIYAAAGAGGTEGKSRLLAGLYGAQTIAFGV